MTDDTNSNTSNDTADHSNVVNFPPEGATADERKDFLRQPNLEFMTMLETAASRLDEIAAQRKGLNDEASAEFANFERYGLNKHAVRAALRYCKLDPEQRENYDLSYQVMRRAKGLPVQPDLFEAQLAATVEHETKRRKGAQR